MKFLLAFLTIYLIIRYIIPSIFKMIFASMFKSPNKKTDFNKSSSSNKRKTNDKYGEYIDYEDIDE